MQRYTLMLVLAAAVVVAGCTLPGGQTEESEPKVIQVVGPDCTVAGERCDLTTITRFGGPAEVRVEVRNFGDERMDIPVGSRGQEILIARCNDELATLDPEQGGGFSGRIEGTTRFEEFPDADAFPDTVTLRGGERLIMAWTLAIPEDADVTRLGYSCPLDFELSFNQTIRSGQQLQLKADDEVPDVSRLDTSTTAEQPVTLEIDAPRSFVVDRSTLSVQGFLRNRGRGEITDIIRIEADPDEPGVLADAECRPPNDELRMYGAGARRGQSYRKTCTLPAASLGLAGTSDIRWARYIAEYSYRMPLGSTTIQLAPVEGES